MTSLIAKCIDRSGHTPSNRIEALEAAIKDALAQVFQVMYMSPHPEVREAAQKAWRTIFPEEEK